MYREISVRRVGSCSECGEVIPVGARALWNQAQRTLVCISHSESEVLEPKVEHRISDLGIAGASALAMSQKFQERDQIRSTRDQEVFRISHPFLSKYITPKPRTSHQTKVWSKGAEGEVEVGKILDYLARKYGFLAIHDRQMPRSRANIDHMAITSTGIFIVDAKNYQGKIEVRGRLDQLAGGSSQLWIGRRNRTVLVDGVNKQIVAVEGVLEKARTKFPVFGALAFYKATWDLPAFLRASSVNGILINSRGLEHIFEKLAPNDRDQIAGIAEILLSNLRPAS